VRDYIKVSLLDWTPSKSGDSMTKLSSLSHLFQFIYFGN
jgi:hypothetical protein